MAKRLDRSGWLAAAPLVFALAMASSGCKKSEPARPGPLDAAAPYDAGVQQLLIVLPDAGPDAIATAQEILKAQHYPDAPVRIEMIADLLAPKLVGLGPGATAAEVEKKFGPAEEKKDDVWRWPSLGVEAVIESGIVQRLALHATTRPDDPAMRVFVGEVLLGPVPLTKRAPDLTIRELVLALGADGGKGQTDGNVTELAWKREGSTLFLTFDDETLHLEAMVLEPFSQKLWDSMKPLEVNRQLWDLDPAVVLPKREDDELAFAQVPGSIGPDDVARMRLVTGAQPGGQKLFDTLASRYLAPGESLRKLNGQPAAMLRASGCAFLVLEKADGSWEARNATSTCRLLEEKKGLDKIRSSLAPAAK